MILGWKNFTVKLDRFHKYLETNLPNYDGMVSAPENLNIIFKSEPSQGDLDFVQNYWNSRTEQTESTPTQEEVLQSVQNAIKAAVDFGHTLILKASVENVTMGITQAGKTAAVVDYCTKLHAYLQTGSLYAALSELDALIGAGLPPELAPFVTEERLNSYKSQIQTFLGIS